MTMTQQKTILITGCSSGIGLDAAHTLHARGWRVFATCRQPVDCEHLQSKGLESYPLDYTNPDSIATAVQETLSRTGGILDAVFNNGAYAIPGAIEDLPRDALRAIFETNFFGVHDLTTRLIPIMRKQGFGRIVQCSSLLGYVALRWRGAYNSTKYALEGLTDTLRLELGDSGIHVILIEPGPITSLLRQKSIPHFEHWIDAESSVHKDIYKTAFQKRFEESQKPDPFELPAAAVSQKLIHALEAKHPRARYRVTFPAYLTDALRRILPTRALDRVLKNIV